MLRICITSRERFFLNEDYQQKDYDLLLLELEKRKTTPDFILLREQLDFRNSQDYRRLAEKLLPTFGKKLILHSRAELANEFGVPLHFSYMQVHEILNAQHLNRIPFFSVSVHSVDQVKELEKLPKQITTRIRFLLAGHVFSTPSHPQTPGKGLNWLKKVVDNSSLDIIAVGGINNLNMKILMDSGIVGWAGISTWLEN
ncbi:MAG: thiamine phosphate synthase [Candidatus Ancillula sp.]|jgi:thiamine monophosphate synthase|nr:thiamine phosphate synthase [Candidatus Ancillula sp.]